DTVKAHIGRNAAEAFCWVEATRQMQRCQYMGIHLSRPLPEAAGMVMDKIERVALAGMPPHKLNDAVFMFIAPSLIVVGLCAGITGRKQLATHARSRRRGHCGLRDGGNFALQRP